MKDKVKGFLHFESALGVKDNKLNERIELTDIYQDLNQNKSNNCCNWFFDYRRRNANFFFFRNDTFNADCSWQSLEPDKGTVPHRNSEQFKFRINSRPMRCIATVF